jgi:hypothetical protein
VLAADRRLAGLLAHVLALGEHGRGEADDLLDGNACRHGDLVGALTTTDARLDVTGAEGTLHAGLQLAGRASSGRGVDQGSETAIGRDVEGLVGGVVARDEEPSVLAQSVKTEFTHGMPPDSS